MKPKISVICVYNNEEQLNTQLRASLNIQNVEYETVFIDNRENQFSSCAKALNYGASKAHGDILVFSHQDITLKTKEGLREFAEAIEKSETGTIVGTQGVVDRSPTYYQNLTAGNVFCSKLEKKFEKKLYPVSTVDEGFFGMKKETWGGHQFDELTCSNWHLYAVEACLYARSEMKEVYVFPIELHHYSWGNISDSYMKELKLLCKKYRSTHKYIWTTCYKVQTNALYINSLVLVWKLKRRLLGK